MMRGSSNALRNGSFQYLVPPDCRNGSRLDLDQTTHGSPGEGRESRRRPDSYATWAAHEDHSHTVSGNACSLALVGVTQMRVSASPRANVFHVVRRIHSEGRRRSSRPSRPSRQLVFTGLEPSRSRPPGASAPRWSLLSGRPARGEPGANVAPSPPSPDQTEVSMLLRRLSVVAAS
jgi:hypothetical protein